MACLLRLVINISSKQYKTLDNSFMLLYTVYSKGSDEVTILLNHSILVPIYEQITDQIKAQIRSGKLHKNDVLPSVRALAKDLKISALTVKKAYDALEAEGLAETIHGKGTYITAANKELLLDDQKKEIEAELERIIQKSRRCGLSDNELRSLFDLLMEDTLC